MRCTGVFAAVVVLLQCGSGTGLIVNLHSHAGTAAQKTVNHGPQHQLRDLLQDTDARASAWTRATASAGQRASTAMTMKSARNNGHGRAARRYLAPQPADWQGVHYGAELASGATGGAMGILHPMVVQSMRDAWMQNAEGKYSQELSIFFEDYQSIGPMAAMAHMSNPRVSSQLAVLMGQALGHR